MAKYLKLLHDKLGNRNRSSASNKAYYRELLAFPLLAASPPSTLLNLPERVPSGLFLWAKPQETRIPSVSDVLL